MEIQINRDYKSTIMWEEFIPTRSILSKKTKAFVIVDSKARWFLEDLFQNAETPEVFIFEEPDENKKDFKTVNKILDFLFKHKADRTSLLVAVGGGVTLDTAGFAASIFKRGINWVAVPTTLLAQVDASVGGKTAINHATGKNSIGAFHPPVEVIVSDKVAESWKKFHYLEGIAEMYKIFSIFEIDTTKSLISDGVSGSLTRRSIELKASVVNVDPWEQHLRAILNYGHTIGHAIEHMTHHRHGIAVSIGMRIENLIATRLGIMREAERERMNSELDMLEFPSLTRLPKFSRILPFLLQDKKNVLGKVNMSLIEGGKCLQIKAKNICTPVELDIIEECYNKSTLS